METCGAGFGMSQLAIVPIPQTFVIGVEMKSIEVVKRRIMRRRVVNID